MSLYGSPSQPDFAAALATIQGWDKDRLQELLNDEDKFNSLIKGLSQIKSLHDEKEMLMASNRSLAEYNLSQEPVLKDLKTQLADKHREAMRTAEKVKNAKRELDEKSGSVEPDTLLALLQVWPLFSRKNFQNVRSARKYLTLNFLRYCSQTIVNLYAIYLFFLMLILNPSS